MSIRLLDFRSATLCLTYCLSVTICRNYLNVKEWYKCGMWLKVILQYCIAQPYYARASRHWGTQMSACNERKNKLPQAKLDSEINARFLLNERGDL